MSEVTSLPVALVTGASSGMGREIARDLGLTHRVILVGRDPERLAEAVTSAGEHAESWRLELTDTEALEAHVAKLDRLDVLVHAAAIGNHIPVDQAEASDWARFFAVNVTAPAVFTKAALPLLRAARGTVVFIGSGASTNAVSGSGPYCASKHALRAVADVLRIDEESNFVRVVTIAPGQTDTAMLKGMTRGAYRPELYIQPSSIARAVRHVVDAPDDVQITDVAVRPRREIARIK